MQHIDPITMTLGGNNKAFLILNNHEKKNSIIDLLKLFKECGENSHLKQT